jgi:hypothetical protein
MDTKDTPFVHNCVVQVVRSTWLKNEPISCAMSGGSRMMFYLKQICSLERREIRMLTLQVGDWSG